LIVNADSKFKTLDDLIKFGKSNPQGLTFGSPGAASAPHLTAELLFRSAGVKGLNVHYRGDAGAYAELLAGRIDATLTAITTAIPHIQAGKLRVLAVANEERTPLFPDAKTFREQGLPDVVGYGWYGMMAPAGTPDAIVQRLNGVINAALKEPAIRDKSAGLGLELRGGTPAEFAQFIDREAAKWAKVIKAANITAE
ncbi:MAG: tripartite tricarboxylate transporter substrate binding protein, partial [Gammaproteobacteria bacterium]|nr:tripartite tricarboxylate transporter substrate binding protein [Gammaproteobacteria bacterium]